MRLFGLSILFVLTHLAYAGAPILIPSTDVAPIPGPLPAKPTQATLLAIWKNSAPVTNDFLKGVWVKVSRATDAKCGDRSKNASNAKGFRNADGTYDSALTFSEVSGSTLSVSLSGIGGKDANQGPYMVEASEPQFARWIFGFGVDRKDVYLEYSCRDSRDGNMICGVTQRWKLDPTDPCYNDSNGELFIYARRPNL